MNQIGACSTQKPPQGVCTIRATVSAGVGEILNQRSMHLIQTKSKIHKPVVRKKDP
jgi:hypothetical protein